MMDSLNNRILAFLERKSWRLAGYYWRTIGKHIRVN